MHTHGALCQRPLYFTIIIKCLLLSDSRSNTRPKISEQQKQSQSPSIVSAFVF